jgi:hypothetical protein
MRGSPGVNRQPEFGIYNHYTHRVLASLRDNFYSQLYNNY